MSRKRGKRMEGPRVVSRYRGSYDDIAGRMALHESGRDNDGVLARIRAAARKIGLPWDERDERRGAEDSLWVDDPSSRLARRSPPPMKGAEAFAASEEMASIAASGKPALEEGPTG